MELAKELLRDPNHSIIETGLDVGFRNPSHFARMFRKLEGVTPSQFRADCLPEFRNRSGIHAENHTLVGAIRLSIGLISHAFLSVVKWVRGEIG